MQIVNSHLGLEIKTDRYYAFFGNKNANLDLLKKKFPEYQFFRIKQTHSNIALEADVEMRDADAHYTKVNNSALLIATADCAPILIYDTRTCLIASVHAGWKGVATRILPLTIAALIKKGASIKDCLIYIGPHILQNSFEVEAEVRDQLQVSLLSPSKFEEFCFSKKIEGQEKYYVNLKAILLEQILEMGGIFDQVASVDIDTKSNLDWHSFRRDKANSGRNLSFIVAY